MSLTYGARVSTQIVGDRDGDDCRLLWFPFGLGYSLSTALPCCGCLKCFFPMGPKWLTMGDSGEALTGSPLSCPLCLVNTPESVTCFLLPFLSFSLALCCPTQEPLPQRHSILNFASRQSIKFKNRHAVRLLANVEVVSELRYVTWM